MQRKGFASSQAPATVGNRRHMLFRGLGRLICVQGPRNTCITYNCFYEQTYVTHMQSSSSCAQPGITSFPPASPGPGRFRECKWNAAIGNTVACTDGCATAALLVLVHLTTYGAQVPTFISLAFSRMNLPSLYFWLSSKARSCARQHEDLSRGSVMLRIPAKHDWRQAPLWKVHGQCLTYFQPSVVLQQVQ